MQEHVILVDNNDNPLGIMEKMEAHKNAVLHRAFSVFRFNSNGEMMLQLRAKGKYHSGGLWTNACCGHPKPNETVVSAAERRLHEEMGIKCHLEQVSHHIYKTPFPNGLTEHEYLHILKGVTNTEPRINPEEADGWKWISIKQLYDDVRNQPEHYAEWFKISLEKGMF